MADPTRRDDARESMLAEIRRHLAASPRPAEPPTSAGSQAAAGADPDGTATPPAHDPALLDTFRAALTAVGASCHVARDEQAAAECLDRLVEAAAAQRIVASRAPLVQAVLRLARIGAVVVSDAGREALLDAEIGITGAQLAIAETGTLVLDGDVERHRLTSLLPPIHVAIIESSVIRRTMAEALDTLGSTPTDASRIVTFVTGPSRTADIELTPVVGVHGPQALDVLVVHRDDEASA